MFKLGVLQKCVNLVDLEKVLPNEYSYSKIRFRYRRDRAWSPPMLVAMAEIQAEQCYMCTLFTAQIDANHCTLGPGLWVAMRAEVVSRAHMLRRGCWTEFALLDVYNWRSRSRHSRGTQRKPAEYAAP